MDFTPTLLRPSRLIEFDGNRANNFTSVRLVLAWLVLYGHSFAIARVPGLRDPLAPFFQGSIWIGELAVSGFFAISGFLVAASFVRRGLADYLISRVLRIYPALALCVLLSVFLLGPLMTTLPLTEYALAQQTHRYLLNAFAFFEMQWQLPGLFEGNARPAVNGSLWTLTAEVNCYVFLAVVGLLGCLRDRVIANVAMLALLAFGYFYYDDLPLLGLNSRWQQPACYFLLGVFFYVNRAHVILDVRLAVLMAGLASAAMGKAWFSFVFPPALVYLLFFVAYKTPFVDVDRRVGDISYGIYIYAWPIQQVVTTLAPAEGPYFNMAVSTLFVIVLAWMSWHFLERPALSLKSRWMKTPARQPR